MVERRARDAAGKRDRATARIRAFPRQLAANGYTHCSCGGTPPTGNGSPITRRRTGCVSRRVRRCRRVRGDGATAGDLYGNDDGVLSARARAAWTWRWMGDDAAWRIVNTSGAACRRNAQPRNRRRSTTRDAGGASRRSASCKRWSSTPPRRTYELGPLVVPAGEQRAHFSSGGSAGGGRRHHPQRRPAPLSFAFGTWHWIVPGRSPDAEPSASPVP